MVWEREFALFSWHLLRHLNSIQRLPTSGLQQKSQILTLMLLWIKQLLAQHKITESYVALFNKIRLSSIMLAPVHTFMTIFPLPFWSVFDLRLSTRMVWFAMDLCHPLIPQCKIFNTSRIYWRNIHLVAKRRLQGVLSSRTCVRTILYHGILIVTTTDNHNTNKCP